MGRRQDIAELQSTIFKLEERISKLEDDDSDDGSEEPKPKRFKCNDCHEECDVACVYGGFKCSPCAISDLHGNQIDLFEIATSLTHFIRDHVPHTGAYVPCPCDECKPCKPIKFEAHRNQ